MTVPAVAPSSFETPGIEGITELFTFTSRETVCTADIELLSMSVRPFYLPREFPQIFLTVVYIHPKANASNAVSTIHKGAYKAVALPPLGFSDHNTIFLTPTYKPILKRGKTTTRQVEMWTESAIDELKGALECTDWNVFNSPDLDERTEVISSYVKYLKDSVIPTKHVKTFPNNKPWLNTVVKDALHRKHKAYLHGGGREKSEAKK
ncbi:hypothetical protein N1851_015528 [Merluccius polli]|uniref:Uncharacterized protein n=1 Tax=Merluccius polli TaxID=89951 RepID=A0AA47MSA0_MERPO|nr:hypothetical protein N1851_015528 [Merluccius polli]